MCPFYVQQQYSSPEIIKTAVDVTVARRRQIANDPLKTFLHNRKKIFCGR
jgi:hypothetical protein